MIPGRFPDPIHQILTKYRSFLGVKKQELIQARHPIIKCHYTYMNMEFDLSYADMSVFEMGKLHNFYSAYNENVRIFISILRIWVG